MEENNNNPTPQENEMAQSAPLCETDNQENLPKIERIEKAGPTLNFGRWIFVTCLLLAAAILLTYTFTAAAWRRAYTEKLLDQQKIIQGLSGQGSKVADNFEILNSILESSSFYAETMDEKAMLEAAYKAYVAASGDAYARYYTEEEYREILSSNQAELYGVGIGVLEYTFRMVDETSDRLGFYIHEIYEGSTAIDQGIKVGDWVYAVEIDGVMKTVTELGYTAAANAIRGEKNTTVKVQIYRPNDQGGGDFITSGALTRRKFETKSVKETVLESNPSVGIVKITSFDLKTPSQFKAAIQNLKNRGVEQFVFDLRGNLGGDLQSIKAIMSYFLQKGDLVLEAISRNGDVAASYCVEAVTHMDPTYTDCDVAEEEIGMFADLDMVVLCNKSTASAAEVFVATMQDYGLAKIIGTQTYGKGIMQSTRQISFANLVGYIKFTTYAYQTKRGESYHGVGITPDYVVELSDESKKLPLLLLGQDQDEQLNTAVQILAAQQ